MWRLVKAGQFGVRTAVQARDFLFSVQVQTDSGAHPASRTRGTTAPSRG